MPPCRPAVCSSSPTRASRRSTSSVRSRCSRRPTGCPARTHYDVAVAARNDGPVTSMSGLALCADRRLGALRGRFDTLVVAGGDGTVEALRDRSLIETIGRLAARSRRVTSVCSGAFLLAEAGLLDGRRATTHWSVCRPARTALPGRRGRPRADLRARRQRVHVRRRDRGHGPRARPGRGRPRSRGRARASPAGSCCSCDGPATRRSSARNCRRSSRSATTCARCSGGSPTTPRAICRSRRWRRGHR